MPSPFAVTDQEIREFLTYGNPNMQVKIGRSVAEVHVKFHPKGKWFYIGHRIDIEREVRKAWA